MIDYLAHNIEINPNNGTVAAIESDKYLQSINGYIPEIEDILLYYSEKLEEELAAGIEYASTILNDHDAIVEIIKYDDFHWYNNHLKNTKEWIAWDNDRIFNENRWFWQQARQLSEEPTTSENALEDKIQHLKDIFEITYVQHMRHADHYKINDINNNIVKALAYKYLNYATEQTKEEAQAHLYFLKEVRGMILAANYNTFYVSHNAMVRLSKIDKFISDNLKEKGE